MQQIAADYVASASFGMDKSGFEAIKACVHNTLLETLDLNEAQRMPVEQLQRECSRRIDVLLTEQRCPLSAPDRQRLLRGVLDEVFGLGPIEEFLRDPTICDVLVNGPGLLYINPP